MKMHVGNKRIRFLVILTIAIYCLILLFFVHLSGHQHVLRGLHTVQPEIITTNHPLYLSPPSPLPSPHTVETNRDWPSKLDSPGNRLDDLMTNFSKYLNSGSKISALKGPRLDRMWNIWNMTYTIDRANICEASNVSTVIVVMSSPGNVQSRNSIRSTWGSNLTSSYQMRLVYFVGMSGDRDIERDLQREAKREGDVVQASFVDTYRNLTLKSVMLLRWVSSRCPSATFVLKVDDDVFINPTNLQRFVESRKQKQLSIFGHAAHRWRPVRTNSSHYYVEESLWTSPIYPDFMTGPAYLLTMDAIPLLLKQVSKVPFFFLEDVYVTGILAERANIFRIHCAKFRNVYIPVNPCVYHKVISVHRLNATAMRAAWDVLRQYPSTNIDGCWTETCSWMVFGLCMAKEKSVVNFMTLLNNSSSVI